MKNTNIKTPSKKTDFLFVDLQKVSLSNATLHKHIYLISPIPICMFVTHRVLKTRIPHSIYRLNEENIAKW